MSRRLYSVAVYHIDRACGGPEEGGWWYNYGAPAPQYEQFTRLYAGNVEGPSDAAYAYVDRLNRVLCNRLNRGLPSISSVLSVGRYEARMIEGLPRRFPSSRPHYE